MLAGPSAGNEEDIGSEVEQPCERDLCRSRPEARAEVDEDGTREDRILSAPWPAQREKRYECDSLQGTFGEETDRALIGEIEQVLHANDLRLVNRSVQVPCRYVAQTYPVDQSFVTGRDKRGELRVEAVTGFGSVHDAKVYGGQPIQTEGQEVLLDARAELIWLVVGEHGTRVIANAPQLC